MTYSFSKPPIWFWVVSVLALIWNLIGVLTYFLQAFMTEAEYEALSEIDRTMFENFPVWFTVVYAIAVFAGALGSISLIIRKRWAYALFILSLIAVAFHQAYILIIIKPTEIIMSLLILVVAVFLVWFSKKAVTHKWLN